MNDTAPIPNVPEFTVSEISGAVKRTLESEFGRIRVRGEITELKRYPSGHIYFSLKDENSKISGVVWKFSVPRLGLVPENGTEVIATGKISAYGERSSYQLIVERMEYAGAGALLARIVAWLPGQTSEPKIDWDSNNSIQRRVYFSTGLTLERLLPILTKGGFALATSTDLKAVHKAQRKGEAILHRFAQRLRTGMYSEFAIALDRQ